MDILNHALTVAGPYLHRYGYAAIFVGALIEGVGIPAPGLTLLVAAHEQTGGRCQFVHARRSSRGSLEVGATRIGYMGQHLAVGFPQLPGRDLGAGKRGAIDCPGWP